MANNPLTTPVIPAVRVAEGLPRAQRMGLYPDTLVFQQAAGNGEESAVIFVADSHVGAIVAQVPAGRLGDRGKKHVAKPLSHYVGVRGGLVLVRAAYTEAGQALRGARALLAHCRKTGRVCHCLVAVPEGVFARLEGKASVTEARPLAPALQVLRDQCADLTIPAELRRTFLGSSAHADWVRRLIILAARSDQPVLILGETGTGKEVVARQIHAQGARPANSFFTVNCAAIPADLLESELFGHVKGSFTGAISNKTGFWAAASEGTLFLDEVGDLSPTHQAKILRAVEKGVYTPVGGTREQSSKARVIAATNRDLVAMVRAGTFREDLYYRLFSFRIRTPALAEHPEDVPELVAHFWAEIAGPRALPRAVTQMLAALPWPGNVRELRAFLNHLALYANRKPVTTALALAVVTECRGTRESARA